MTVLHDDPNDGMVIRIMPIPDSYCVTTAGHDLLSQVQKVCDERADETAKQAQKELREDAYRKREVRRSCVQWTLGGLIYILGHMVYAEKWKGQLGALPTAELHTAHISEKEVILGLTDRFREAVKNLIRERRPEVIFVIPSSILEMIGTDLGEACDELSGEYAPVKILFGKKGGFKERAGQGIEEALLQLARDVTREPDRREETFNLFGCCADSAAFAGDALEIARIMRGAFSLDMHCALTGISSMERIRTMSRARINLVHRWEALKAAQHLEREYGIPYVYTPAYGLAGTLGFIAEVEKVLGRAAQKAFVERERVETLRYVDLCREHFFYDRKKPAVSVGGALDHVRGIGAFLFDEIGLEKGLVWVCDAADGEISQMSEDQAFERIPKGLAFASPEIVEKAGMDPTHALTWSTAQHEINPYAPPFAGFRGAIQLCCLLMKR